MSKESEKPARILTEEELQEAENDIYGELGPSERQKLLNLLDSHRSLLSANAELSFENMKYKQDQIKLLQACGEIIPICKSIVILDILQNVMLDLFENRMKEELK